MNRVFVDTGAWYALVDASDPDHLASARFLKANTFPLVTTNFVFDETVTLLRRRLGWSTACEFGSRMKKSDFVSMVCLDGELEDRAWAIFRKYKDKDFSYTDCTSFATMSGMDLQTAFTFDSHFSAMKFRIVPGLA